jgi:suppressor of G2 allele of SKP1
MSKIESAEAIFNKANSAFVDENFTEALELYNTAIEMEPSNPEFYIKRSACHYRLKRFTGKPTFAPVLSLTIFF